MTPVIKEITSPTVGGTTGILGSITKRVEITSGVSSVINRRLATGTRLFREELGHQFHNGFRSDSGLKSLGKRSTMAIL
jgi:hypothetical protein